MLSNHWETSFPYLISRQTNDCVTDTIPRGRSQMDLYCVLVFVAEGSCAGAELLLLDVKS